MTLEEFLTQWQDDYSQKAQTIKLFQPEIASSLNKEQRQLFARAFYHARGHFYRFLWYVGSLAPSEEYKKVVLANISEEFGGSRKSHEQLYFEFAEALEVDPIKEIISGENDLAFIQEFNRGHVDWLLSHDWDHVWSAFSAYEKLDNVDYENLYKLTESFGLGEKELLFFHVHRLVEHYEAASTLLQDVWDRNPEGVKAGFEFIGSHQLSMWNDLSDAVLKG